MGHSHDRMMLRSLTALRRSARADAVAVVTPMRVGEECRTAFRAGVGDDELLAALGRMHDTPLSFSEGAVPSCIGERRPLLPPMWMLRLSKDSLTAVDVDWTDHGFPHSAVDPPAPLAPTLWSLCVNQSGHLVGLTVVTRWAAHRPFSVRSRRKANRALSALYLEPPEVPAVPAVPAAVTLLYTAEGTFVAGSELSKAVVDGPEHTLIGGHVRRFAADREPNGTLTTLMGELHFERLISDADADRVVVSLTPSRLYRVLALQALTSRQREIAIYAASGATSVQIGQGLALSVNTVKHHLKSVYLRLKVRDRDDLRSLLLDQQQQPPRPPPLRR